MLISLLYLIHGCIRRHENGTFVCIQLLISVFHQSFAISIITIVISMGLGNYNIVGSGTAQTVGAIMQKGTSNESINVCWDGRKKTTEVSTVQDDEHAKCPAAQKTGNSKFTFAKIIQWNTTTIL